jgi:hypothetical protein
MLWDRSIDIMFERGDGHLSNAFGPAKVPIGCPKRDPESLLNRLILLLIETSGGVGMPNLGHRGFIIHVTALKRTNRHIGCHRIRGVLHDG